MTTSEEKAREYIDQALRKSGPHASGRQPSINLAPLLPYRVLTPPTEGRQKIVAGVEHRLFTIEELEATVEANLTRADRLRQAILKRACSGELIQAATSVAVGIDL